MRLIVIHYHWRPSGVRKVIETALPVLMKQLSITGLVLASGEAIDPAWIQTLQAQLGPTRLECFTEPCFLYFSEQTCSLEEMQQRLRQGMQNLLATGAAAPSVVWAHNLGIGRNLLFARELIHHCRTRNIRLILHHHDWWFDNRWPRWKEFRKIGIRTQQAVAQVVFPSNAQIAHVTINQEDHHLIQRHLPQHTYWCPNPVLTHPLPRPRQLQNVRRWLRAEVGLPQAPCWLLPTRLLRRKNLAEAILLTRWLRPEAWLITTGGVSSAEELDYAQALQRAALHHQWQVKFSVLANSSSPTPSVPELMAASEVILLTSLQEGFGLPYLEATAAQRPLVARAMPNVIPDLQRFGFNFEQLYTEILVDSSLFDWSAERIRQTQFYRIWLTRVPTPMRQHAGLPFLLKARSPSQPVPFSRLTLKAQIEVLSQPPDVSWTKCAPLNPFLEEWQHRARTGALRTTPWPDSAQDWLSGEAYALRFHDFLRNHAAPPSSLKASLEVQTTLVRRKLHSSNLYPLLW